MAAVLLFAAFGILGVVSFWRDTGTTFAIGAIITVFVWLIAIYAGVGSQLIADRRQRALIVRRRIGLLTWEKSYQAGDIHRVEVVSTPKGSDLSVRLRSGRKKSLTISLGYGDRLYDDAASLNEFLHVPHRG